MESLDLTQAEWRKSSRSNGGGQCVEVALTSDVVGVRDSKLGEDSPILAVDPTSFASFVDSLRRGDVR